MTVPTFTRIGYCIKPRGVNGHLRVVSDDGFEELLKTVKFLFFDVDGCMVPQKVEERKKLGDGWSMKMVRINSKEEAALYSDGDIFVESHLSGESKKINPKPFEGWKLIDRNSGKEMKIKSIEEYPKQLMMVCQLNESEILIPFAEDWIEEVVPDDKELIMNLPEGLV